MVNLRIYQDLKKEIGSPKNIKSNILVLSLPTMGASYLAKKYVEEYPEVKYVYGPNQELSDSVTILYLAYDIDPNVFVWADDYIRGANLDQKFIIILNSPDAINTEKYHRSYLSGHIYQTVWLRVVGDSDIKIIASNFKNDVTQDNLVKICELSGGLAQIIKYLSINLHLLDKPNEVIIADPGLKKIMDPLVAVSSRCSMLTLDKMGLVANGQIKSKLLCLAIDRLGGIKERIDISISFDLTIEEKGKKTGESVTPQEKNILEEMILGNGNITKEKVSDIKWGEGKYDEFSDQAINKTMRRLSTKLKSYQIETIPKTGYRIIDQKSAKQ